jgi:hypothetical protein
MPRAKSKIIRDIQDLPSWYDLNKYKEAKKLTARGWYEQLIVRSSYQALLERRPLHERLASFLKEMRRTPIINIEDPALTIMLGGGKLEALKGDDAEYAAPMSGVYSLTPRDLYFIERNISEEQRKYAKGFIEQIFGQSEGPLKKLRYRLQKWIIEPAYKTSSHKWAQGAVMVNLALPDKVLEAHFRGFLKKKRAELSVLQDEQRHHSIPFQRWVDCGLLPYLDLRLWAQENELKIPHHILAKSIYHKKDNDPETVRKVTALMAAAALSKEGLIELEALASTEL